MMARLAFVLGCRLMAAAVALAAVAGTIAEAAAQERRLSFIRDAEIEHTIRTFAEPIARAAGINPAAMDYYLVADRSMNAFVAGGQNMFLNTGTLVEAQGRRRADRRDGPRVRPRRRRPPGARPGPARPGAAHGAADDAAGRRDRSRLGQCRGRRGGDHRRPGHGPAQLPVLHPLRWRPRPTRRRSPFSTGSAVGGACSTS